jgi:murein DD-endopeptidase MepM/ murein hydrolase activator NlpD
MYAVKTSFTELLVTHSGGFHKVVDYNPAADKLVHLDFTANNQALEEINRDNIEVFTGYIRRKLDDAKAKFGIGGYDEQRILYKSSTLFTPPPVFNNGKENITEPRNIHLGIDIWGDEGTKVYAPLGGMIHSFAFNNHPGDYGPTIVLLHQLEGRPFYTIYGHLSVKDIEGLKEGAYISRGEVIGHFGNVEENGGWPPHLHFQVIKDMRMYKGDYPGVCKISERAMYLENCPDPDLVLNMMKYVLKK